MRRIALAALAVLVFAPAANADCGVTSSVVSGSSPLRVSFTAGCQSGVYQWSFGDGGQGQGQATEHVYSAGRFTPALTTDAGAQTLPQVTSISMQRSGGGSTRRSTVVFPRIWAS